MVPIEGVGAAGRQTWMAMGGDATALGRIRPMTPFAGSVSAWGSVGPWAERRGFDSIVQAATGIAMIESTDGRTPGALPAQVLDHASGHLLAAGVVRALVDRETGLPARTPGSTDSSVSRLRSGSAVP